MEHLHKYIEEARQLGHNDKQIHSSLTGAGWHPDQVNKAINHLLQKEHKAQELHKRRRPYVLSSLIFLVVIILAGLLLVSHKSTTKNETTQNQTSTVLKTYTDPTKTFSFQYPSNWTVHTSPNNIPKAGTLPIVATSIENTFIEIPGAPIIYGKVRNSINLKLNQSTDVKGLFCEITMCSPERSDIAGYPALYEHQSAAKVNDYVNADAFAINHGDKTLLGDFPESRDRSFMPNIPGTNQSSHEYLPAYNESAATPAYNALINSIKFLN